MLQKYEKASGSRINYNKTKSISIGTAHHRKPKFNNTGHGFGLQYVN
jgi:hypothetical protein